MIGTAFLRLKKLTGPGIMSKAARHNKRVIQAELGSSSHINATRSNLNINLMGPSTAEEVAQLAKDKIAMAGITKPRKDAVIGVELVFSLPPNHGCDVFAFFTACAHWAGSAFGGQDNIVSADIHRDESQDHAHVLLVPLIDGRLRGSDAVGNKKKLSELQAKFFKDVAAGFGFSKPRARPSGHIKAQTTRQVLDKLRQDPASKSAAWAVIRDNVERDPMPFALALGVAISEAPAKRLKTVREIFQASGKGSRYEKPTGFDSAPKPISVSSSVNKQSLQSPRLSREAPPEKKASTKANHGHSQDTESPEQQAYRVEREGDYRPEYFDPVTGEYFNPTGKTAANNRINYNAQG